MDHIERLREMRAPYACMAESHEGEPDGETFAACVAAIDAAITALSARASAGEGGEWVMVPRALTAENGAKGLLSGEFCETLTVSCPEPDCDEDCPTCDGRGEITHKVPVSWTTIKEIHRMMVEHFAAAPTPTDESGQGRESTVADDTARLDFIERTFSGMTNRERYLPVQMVWGKGCNGRTLREACDKYMKRDTALALPAQGEG